MKSLVQASPQSPTLVLRGFGITVPDGALDLLINPCQQQLWPMAPGAVGWISACLRGMLAHPGCLCVCGETGVQPRTLSRAPVLSAAECAG